MTSVVVLGAGVAGLAAAQEVRAVDPDATVRVIEASHRAGGLVQTEHLDGGWVLEHGPDSMASFQPAGVRAAKDAGLTDVLAHPNPGATWMVRDDRLHALPTGLLGASSGVGMALLASRLFSPLGKARMVLEPLVRPDRSARDESVAAFFRRRFGPEFTTRLVEPLLRGIYRTPTERLSLEATLPRFQALEREHGSVVLGLHRGRKKAAAPSGPPLVGFRDGMSSLPEALAASLDVHYGRAAARIRRGPAGTWRVDLDDGSTVAADAVIAAVPAWVVARLVDRVDEDLAIALSALRFTPITLATFGWRESLDLPDGTGFLVPHEEGRSITACTLVTNKWAGRAPDGATLLRVSSRIHGLPADDVVDAARRDLADLLGIDRAPDLVRVHRLRQGLPRRDVGHAERVDRLVARTATLPGLALAGSAQGASGVPACIQSGIQAAHQALRAA